MYNSRRRRIINEDEYKKDHPKRNVSIVVIISTDNKILMTRSHILPDKWQPIGGGIESLETPIEAAIREVHEETCIKYGKNELIKVLEVPYDFGEGTIYCFKHLIKVDKEDLKIDCIEIIEYRWVSIKDALKLQCSMLLKSL